MLKPQAHEQRSLFGEILDWMLAPLLLLWPMSLGLTWLVAQSIANKPFDRELADMALALARQSAVHAVGDSQLRNELQRTAAALMRSDDDPEDNVYFQVLGPRGELVAGDASVPVPTEDPLPGGAVRFRDDVIADEPVRVAFVALPGARGRDEALVQVAETLGKRSRLATEIIKGVLLPQFD